MNDLKTIDIELLMESSGDDRELAMELIQLSLDLVDTEMLRLEQASDAGDSEKLRTIAHKCAGSSLACGMRDLAALLRTLEYEASSGVVENAPNQIKRIKEAILAVKADAVLFASADE